MAKIPDPVAKFFKNKAGKVVIWQFPNLPLIAWLALAFAASLARDGGFKTMLEILGTAALIIWSLLELISGASLFRRCLGAIVLVWIILPPWRF